VDRALNRRPTISPEQAEMVRRLVLDGDGVAVVIGQAGTGKTYALAAAREAWEGSGFRVVGASLARRAAIELEDGAGIESTSIAGLLDDFRRRPMTALPRRSVLVVDEAGMVPTRALAEISEHIERVGAKLVLVGDDRQLPEIGAGGTFGALARSLPAIELRENRRQAFTWERDALAMLRAGNADGAIRRYVEHGRIVTGASGDDVRGRLVSDWWRAGDPDDAVMIAHRRRDVADLNGRAHALMRAAGVLGQDEIAGREGRVAVGDRVVMRRNDRKLGVVNGERGTVVGLDAKNRHLEIALRGRHIRLDREYVEEAVDLGYAITGHAAQGMTCAQTFVLATDGLSKEWAYVALSRGRESNRLYATREAQESAEFAPNSDGTWRPAEVLRDGLTRSAAHVPAIEQRRRGHGLER
jgi:ATP-dependent exoDNAse (exonuclease V) alpha subunit